MKRIVIALLILAAIIGNGCWSLWNFASLRRQAQPLLAAMEEFGIAPQGQEAAGDFLDLWLDYEDTLLRVTRRDTLEDIGQCAARLPVLAKFGDETEFYAGVWELGYLLQEMWENEIPHWRNLV